MFKHALVCDALYSGQLSAARTTLHLRIEREIERESEGRLIEVAETLAYHYSRIDQTDKGGAISHARGHEEQPALFARRGRTLRSDGARRRPRAEGGPHGRGNRDHLDRACARIDPEIQNFDVTVLLELEIDGIKALGDILQVPLPLDYYAAALFGCCRFRDARRECDHALVVAEQLNDGRAKAYSRAGIILLSIAIDQMSLPEFERFAEASFAEAQASGDLYIVGRMGFMIGWNYMHRGLTIEGTKWMERLMSFGREHQDPRPMGQAHLVLGWLHIMAEDYTSALSYGLDSMRSACTPQDRTVGKTVVGVSQLMLGRVAEGVETLEQQRAEADSNNWHYTMFGTDTPWAWRCCCAASSSRASSGWRTS